MPNGFAPGAHFAGFHVERLIARGTLGAVYAATDPRNGLPVAIKVLPLASEYDGPDLEEARERFLQEAKTAASLEHPDIVRIFGGGESAGHAFIVMELLGGCDLTRYTRPARLLPEPVVLRIIARLAEALAYAHGRGIVHRDVKPANVMVDLAHHQVKLTDFGIARMADGARSRSGLMVGTPSYMAPEQLAGTKLDGRADLYALGVMLFQLLTGRLPFDGTSLGQLLLQIARSEPLSLRALRPDMPASLDQLVRGLLSKQPAQRPAEGRSLARELLRIEQDWPRKPPPVPGASGIPSVAGALTDPGHNR